MVIDSFNINGNITSPLSRIDFTLVMVRVFVMLSGIDFTLVMVQRVIVTLSGIDFTLVMVQRVIVTLSGIVLFYTSDDPEGHCHVAWN